MFQSLVLPEGFQHILRVMNTNIDGRTKIMYAMTSIKGCGRRFANIVLKKADIDATKRAGELSEEEVDRIITIMQNPRQYKIPDWFLNRQKDIKDGKFSQVCLFQHTFLSFNEFYNFSLDSFPSRLLWMTDSSNLDSVSRGYQPLPRKTSLSSTSN